jgi:hypothetical protein
MPVAELRERMSSREFSEWIAFDNEFNLPDMFYMVAVIAPMIKAAAGKSSRAEEFVPYYKQPWKVNPEIYQSAEEGLAIMRSRFPSGAVPINHEAMATLPI